MDNLEYEINSMGTVLESGNIDTIYEASKKMSKTVHSLGVDRIEVIIKIDSRRDKQPKVKEKMESVKKYIIEK